VRLLRCDGALTGLAVAPADVPQAGGCFLGGRGAAGVPVAPTAAFSLLLKADDGSSAAASLAAEASFSGTALHFELPPGGNGRSRAEWTDALGVLLRAERERTAAPQTTGALVMQTALSAMGLRPTAGGSSAGDPVGTRAALTAVARALLDVGAGRASAYARPPGSAGGTPTRAMSPAPSAVASPERARPPAAERTPEATPPPPMALAALALPPTPPASVPPEDTPTRRVLLLTEEAPAAQ
jgi:hypothetical protein